MVKNNEKIIKKSERKLFFKDDQDSHLAESLRVLRTNIHFMEESENRVIVFTSTIPKEGKSTVAANYAMSVAISGEKVLLVDCDIRRPRAHSSFGIEISKGMGDVLLGNASIDDVILKDVEGGLDILPSKHLKENVTELFLGNRMKKLLEDLRERYDLIVLDTPPIAVATDSVILSEYADGVVYVVGYDMVSKKQLLQSKKLLDRAGAKIYGIEANKINKEAYSYGNYGYYNNNYAYYEEYIKGEK
jgi:capsular exopolysaccharide synthesis family protein